MNHDQPKADENIEESKLELGPNLSPMSWNDAQEKISKLNKNITKGEKPWRLPSKDELVAEFKITNSTPDGFISDFYWSGTTHPDNSDIAYVVTMGFGEVVTFAKDVPDIRARCVR